MYSNKNQKEKIAIFIESFSGDITNLSKELIEEAIKLSNLSNYEIIGLLIGDNLNKEIETLKFFPFSEILVYENKDLEVFTEDKYSEILCSMIEDKNPNIVLIGATTIGKSISPVAATRFKTSLTADCTELKFDEKFNLIQVRPAYSGNLMAEIISKNCKPQIVTMRERNIKFNLINEFKKKLEIYVNYAKLPIFSIQSSVLKRIEKKVDQENDLNKFDTIIAVGNAFKLEKDLDKVFDLSNILNAKVVSTRALVEKGLFEYKNQVGFSGKSISPKLLITLGVSGSIQFQAGILNSEYIISVNNDSKAPIFSICNEGYIGDVYKIIDDLINKFKGSSNYEK
ncbi:MAG: electron transfer flavoprotein subunit alpha/FixB family protein [Cetobacterium sp.]